MRVKASPGTMSDATSAPILSTILSMVCSAAQREVVLLVVLLAPALCLETLEDEEARAPAETASAVSPRVSVAEPSWGGRMRV
jgi:hypothetical protein